MKLGKEENRSIGNGSSNREFLTVSINVNGEDEVVIIEPHWTLIFVLREKRGLLGAKESCGEGVCGACTVLVDGRPTLSCITLARSAAGKSIETIEGVANGTELHPIQEAFLEEHGVQCGYCSPGFIMTTKHLLKKNPAPTEREIREGLAGNICRCGGYEHIVNLVQLAAKKLSEEG